MILACIHTAQTANKGWGVFTSEQIEADTVIELSPVILMSKDERTLIDQTRLYNYIFEWEHNQCCMAMGLIPVYNHACPSNCEYFQDYESGTIYIKTVRDIEADEELTINYNGDWDNTNEVWFEVAE